MKTTYEVNKYTINYNVETKMFSLWDKNGQWCGDHENGRELGRDAWYLGAEAVCYNYDLGLDENMKLDPNL